VRVKLARDDRDVTVGILRQLQRRRRPRDARADDEYVCLEHGSSMWKGNSRQVNVRSVVVRICWFE